VSLNRHEVDGLVEQGRENEVYHLLLSAGRALEAAGADFALICANGVHRFFDRLKDELSLPLLHIADVTAQAIRERGFRTVGLLGIQKTMEGSFYHERLQMQGIRAIVPDLEERRIVHKIIFEELVRSVFKSESKQVYLGIMKKLMEQGAEGIILGCTEIPLLVTQGDTSIALFSTTVIHCEAAVRASLS